MRYELYGDDLEPSSNLKVQVDITGAYGNARSIEMYNHIVTSADVNTWEFTSPFDRCNGAFEKITAEEYKEAAWKIANAAADKYAEKIVKGHSLVQGTDGSSCTHIFQISSMTNEDSVPCSQHRGFYLWGDRGAFQMFVLVTAFDVTQVSLAGIKSNTAGAFIASNSPEMCSSEDALILASHGYPRSMVFDGQLVTFKTHCIKMTSDVNSLKKTVC